MIQHLTLIIKKVGWWDNLEKFKKTLALCCTKPGPVEVSGEGLHPMTDKDWLNQQQ